MSVMALQPLPGERRSAYRIQRAYTEETSYADIHGTLSRDPFMICTPPLTSCQSREHLTDIRNAGHLFHHLRHISNVHNHQPVARDHVSGTAHLLHGLVKLRDELNIDLDELHFNDSGPVELSATAR